MTEEYIDGKCILCGKESDTGGNMHDDCFDQLLLHSTLYVNIMKMWEVVRQNRANSIRIEQEYVNAALPETKASLLQTVKQVQSLEMAVITQLHEFLDKCASGQVQVRRRTKEEAEREANSVAARIIRNLDQELKDALGISDGIIKKFEEINIVNVAQAILEIKSDLDGMVRDLGAVASAEELTKIADGLYALLDDAEKHAIEVVVEQVKAQVKDMVSQGYTSQAAGLPASAPAPASSIVLK